MGKQKVADAKFAAGLKEISTKLLGVDIEENKDSAPVVIKYQDKEIRIGNKESGNQMPFLRGSLIALGQFVRNELQGIIRDKLQIEDGETPSKNELIKKYEEFMKKSDFFTPEFLFNKIKSVKNESKKEPYDYGELTIERVLDAKTIEDIYEILIVEKSKEKKTSSALDIPDFDEKTKLLINVPKTGEVKQFNGGDLFKRTQELFNNFIKENLEVITNAKDIWTELTLKDIKKGNKINVITDARFLTETEIALEEKPDSFLTIILPIIKSEFEENKGELLLNIKNRVEVDAVYSNAKSLQEYIEMVSKPLILQSFFTNKEVERMKEDIIKGRMPFGLLSLPVNPAEELSSLLVLHEFYKKTDSDNVNQFIEADLLQKGITSNRVLVVDSEFGNFAGLIDSALKIENKMHGAKEKITLFSTVSGGGKDTLFAVMKNIFEKQLDYDIKTINKSFETLKFAFSDEETLLRMSEKIIEKGKEVNMENIFSEIVDEGKTKSHEKNCIFLNNIDTLNIAFSNKVGEFLSNNKEELLDIQKKTELRNNCRPN